MSQFYLISEVNQKVDWVEELTDDVLKYILQLICTVSVEADLNIFQEHVCCHDNHAVYLGRECFVFFICTFCVSILMTVV